MNKVFLKLLLLVLTAISYFSSTYLFLPFSWQVEWCRSVCRRVHVPCKAASAFGKLSVSSRLRGEARVQDGILVWQKLCAN